MKKTLSRLLAVLLALSLLTMPALALTAEEAGELLKAHYVDEVPQEVLDQPTVEAMLAALGDPYTEYYDAEAYAAFLATMADPTVGGLGAVMQASAQGAVLKEVTAGSPAEAAGLLAGDILVEIDGHDARGAALEELAAWIRGEIGTRLALTVLRGNETFHAAVTRGEIKLPATTASLLDGRIVYIACTTFGGETEGHFIAGVEKYIDSADGYIVDLRQNSGGATDASVQSAGIFTGPGNMVYLRDKEGRYGVYAREEGALDSKPVTVLVDGGTASAAEIFAAIIRDQGAGIVVGSRTFGKGVAQTMLTGETAPDYFTDGDALKVTAYRFYTPAGTTTDRVGVVPHLLVDDTYAPGAAYLLSADVPEGDTTDMLRLDLNWRWYVNVGAALDDEPQRSALTALLEAIPSAAALWLGTGGPDGWEVVTPAEVARRYQLTGFQSREFTDVSESPYARYINTLATYGILAGGGDGTFRPEASLTRAQFCALLSQALNALGHGGGEGRFADVPQDAWYAPAVNAVTEMGLINGYDDGLFHPDDVMDHQQFVTIMGRLADFLSMNFHEPLREDNSAALEDVSLNAWPSWSRNSVWLLAQSQSNLFGQTLNLLWDDLERIDPTAVTTREEAAALLYSLLRFCKILSV